MTANNFQFAETARSQTAPTSDSPVLTVVGSYVYDVDIMPDSIGQFEQAVLVTLIHLGKDAYGRAVLNEVQSRLKRDVSAGAVYATLERLEAKRLVSSKLAPGTAIRGGRARRYFVPTGAGVRALKDARSSIDSLWHGLVWPKKVSV